MNAATWDAIPAKAVREGVTRKIFSGKNVMLSLVEARAGMQLNPHRHPHEQIIFLLKGRMELRVGDEKRIMTAGDVCHVPPNVEHVSNTLSEEPALILDVFSPIREDYL